MQEQSFAQLAEEAAAGLKADRELFLDVTQELHTHLEAKAESYTRQGKSEEESVALARKAFGSPLDVAASLLKENRRRMKLHSLARMTLGALIVPLAILLALYVGYGRFARQQSSLKLLDGSFDPSAPSEHLPMLPFFSTSPQEIEKQSTLFNELDEKADHGAHILRYWTAHRQEPDSYRYYAYYAASAEFPVEIKDGQQYITAMRQGEQVEPDNALYNILLAYYYLVRGTKQVENTRRMPDLSKSTYAIADQEAFAAGVNELRKAARKPYLRTYQMQIFQQKLSSLPAPLLTEDYLAQTAIAASVPFPQLVKYRDLARRFPDGALAMARVGKTREAESIMDLWRPMSVLLAGDSQGLLISDLTSQACAVEMTGRGIDVYTEIGATAKAREARSMHERLKQVKDEYRTGGHDTRMVDGEYTRKHGGMLARFLFPVFGSVGPTANELIPTRMLEHIVIEEFVVQVMLIGFALALIGTLLQAWLWLFRLRGAASVPILLLPPAREIGKALLFGIALPMLVYWLYSRLPVIGGREYAMRYMWPRFLAELAIVCGIMAWLPARLLRRYMRRRCEELDIPMPPPRQKRVIVTRARLLIAGALALAATAILVPAVSVPEIPRIVAIIMAVGMMIAAIRTARHATNPYGLYTGTLARSMAPLYALTIIFLSLTAQPWLLYQEVHWLRKDTVCFSLFSDRHAETFQATSIETRAAERLSRMLQTALRE